MSCKNVMQLYYGVKKPKVESVNSIRKYINKNNKSSINYELIFFESINSLQNFGDNFGKSFIPDAFFFNTKGEYVKYEKNATECNAYVDDFILDLQNIDLQDSNSRITLSLIRELLVTESNTKIVFPKETIIIILSFAKYIGKVNHSHSFTWINTLNKVNNEGGLNLKIYMLDADLMNFWGIKNKDLNY